jgi:hypothetical protein
MHSVRTNIFAKKLILSVSLVSRRFVCSVDHTAKAVCVHIVHGVTEESTSGAFESYSHIRSFDLIAPEKEMLAKITLSAMVSFPKVQYHENLGAAPFPTISKGVRAPVCTRCAIEDRRRFERHQCREGEPVSECESTVHVQLGTFIDLLTEGEMRTRMKRRENDLILDMGWISDQL